MDVFLTILDVFLPVSGCKNASIGCIYGSNSLYDCIIGRGLYALTNIHPDVFLPVLKILCSQKKKNNFSLDNQPANDIIYLSKTKEQLHQVIIVIYLKNLISFNIKFSKYKDLYLNTYHIF